MRASLLLICVVALTWLLTACKSEEDKKLDYEIETGPPLNLDPTEEYKLSEWWSNEHQLLRLQDDGGYVMFEGLNRYARPVERGRWGKMSYAMLRLEPYNVNSDGPVRVGVDKVDDRIALYVRDLAPFFGIEGPPVTAEDTIIGSWTGAGGSMTLKPDHHYAFAPAVVNKIMTGHSGTWSLNGAQVAMQPDTPAVRPWSLALKVTDGKTMVTGAPGTFERQK